MYPHASNAAGVRSARQRGDLFHGVHRGIEAMANKMRKFVNGLLTQHQNRHIGGNHAPLTQPHPFAHQRHT